MGCFTARRSGRRIPPPCTGPAYSCLSIVDVENEGTCSANIFSKRMFKVRNKSTKTIWAAFEIPTFEMDRYRILSRMENEQIIIKQIPPESLIDLNCEEIGPLATNNPDLLLWRRRQFIISQACYEQSDINCRFFPVPPTEYQACKYEFEIDFNEDRDGRLVGRELNDFYSLLYKHSNDHIEVLGDFNIQFKNFCDVFGINRGPYSLKNLKFENYGTTSFIDFEIVNVPDYTTAWLKLQPDFKSKIIVNQKSVIMDFSEISIPPTLIIGNCDMTVDPANCTPGIIERPILNFQINKDVWLIQAYEFCLKLNITVD